MSVNLDVGKYIAKCNVKWKDVRIHNSIFSTYGPENVHVKLKETNT